MANLYTDDESDCDEFMASAQGSVDLDGESLTTMKLQAELIEIRAVAGNALGERAGTFHALGCGVWAEIENLTPGPHTLRIRGNAGTFAVSVDYDLTIATAVSPAP